MDKATSVSYQMLQFIIMHFLLLFVQEPDSKLAHSPIVTILSQLNDVPEEWRTALQNNGGGFANHIFYWNSMCSAEGIVSHQPIGKLADDIAKAFGSFEDFKRDFDAAGGALFGSGYVWLVESKEGSLSVITTHNQVCIKLYILLFKKNFPF